MKLIQLFALFFFLTIGNNLFAQSFEVPDNYAFTNAADYKKYEKDIIEATKWLIATPLNEQSYKRKEISAFVVEWINGSPTVNVEINATITDFESKNKGMLTLYMACCAKYVLENNYSKDMRAKHKAALSDMVTVYKTGAGIKRDKKMERLIKSFDDGKIDEWLEENLKINR